MKKLAIMALLGVSLLSAKTYRIKVESPSQAGTAQLKPGEYKLKLNGSQAVLTDTRGRTIDSATKVETADHKFNQTAVVLSTVNGSNRIKSIELAGTKTEVFFE